MRLLFSGLLIRVGVPRIVGPVEEAGGYAMRTRSGGRTGSTIAAARAHPLHIANL